MVQLRAVASANCKKRNYLTSVRDKKGLKVRNYLMLVMPEIRFSWTNIVSPLENLIVRYPVIPVLLG
ncbi:MAG: hypothetical protein WCG04_04415, partial [Alphaproteobacteria bacterium]